VVKDAGPAGANCLPWFGSGIALMPPTPRRRDPCGYRGCHPIHLVGIVAMGLA
jgi:hypothetical protein